MGDEGVPAADAMTVDAVTIRKLVVIVSVMIVETTSAATVLVTATITRILMIIPIRGASTTLSQWLESSLPDASRVRHRRNRLAVLHHRLHQKPFG